MTLDLVVLALLAAAALGGARSGALRQLASLAAVAVGVVAARTLADPVADGLARTVSPLARAAAPVLLFLGAFALASLAGGLVLRFTGVARAVRGPADRGVGALLGGAKGGLAIWALLSAVALAGDAMPRAIAARARGSDFFALARAHNLVARVVDAGAVRRLERALDAARRARAAGELARDPDSARLLEQLRAIEGGAAGEAAGASSGTALDPERAARALADPEIRALVERLARRALPPSFP